MRLWLGGYTADMKGTGLGIGVLHAGGAAEQTPSGALAFAGTAVQADSPSWLAPHPTLAVVYAALEGSGSIQAFERTGDETLRPLGAPVFTGMFTCHLAVSPGGGLIVATGYGDGNVAFVAVDEAGLLGEATFGALPTDPHTGTGGGRVDDPALAALRASGFAVAGSSPSTSVPTDGADLAAASAALRAAVGAEFADLIPQHAEGDEYSRFLADQDAEMRARLLSDDTALSRDVAAGIIADAEAPSAAPEPAPTGRVPHAHQARFLSGGLIATTDLGFDLVRFWRRGSRGFDEVQRVVLPHASGPRHMVWHPSGHLHVITEYSCEVFTLAPDAGGNWHIIAAAPVSREVVVGTDFPSELSLSRDASYLYAGVRGSNTIATLAVKENGARLVPVAAVDAHVNWPRHHVLVGDRLFVAGQRSDSVAALVIDERSQLPVIRAALTEAPSPTALLPIFD